MRFMQNIASLQTLNFMHHSKSRVGVLGGTFDPAHAGHLMISIEALKVYRFDYIIWLVANQNPLKTSNRKNIFARAESALELALHQRIIVSTAEHDLNSYYIYDSLKALIQRFPTVKFSWLMGIDNAVSFRKWHRYSEIPKLCDIVIFDRPVQTRLVNSSAFGLRAKAIVAKTQANNIIIYRNKLCNISSTQIRAYE